MPNKSYAKGYRFECEIRELITPYGQVIRAHQSGAYTGEQDFRLVLPDFSTWTFSCKKRKDDPSKFISGELERADFIVWGWNRSLPYLAGPLPKVLEFAKRLGPIEIAEPIE